MTAAALPTCGKTPSVHSQRRTAHSASEELTVALPRHCTAAVTVAAGEEEVIKDQIKLTR